MSDGDNSNILAARVVRETYGVEHVVARIADPGRAEVYQRLGIATVAPVPWTVAQIVGRLLPSASDGAYVDASAGVTMTRASLNEAWVGRRYAELEAAASMRIAYIVRFGAGILPDDATVIQDSDEPYLTFPTSAAAAVERVTSRPPKAQAAGARSKAKAPRGRKAAK